MRVVLPATGHLCGSTFVNTAFINWLVKEHFPSQPASENLNITSASLGYRDNEEFLCRASVEFDATKAAFPMDSRYSVQVWGKAGFKHSWSIPIPE